MIVNGDCVERKSRVILPSTQSAYLSVMSGMLYINELNIKISQRGYKSILKENIKGKKRGINLKLIKYKIVRQ